MLGTLASEVVVETTKDYYRILKKDFTKLLQYAENKAEYRLLTTRFKFTR